MRHLFLVSLLAASTAPAQINASMSFGSPTPGIVTQGSMHAMLVRYRNSGTVTWQPAGGSPIGVYWGQFWQLSGTNTTLPRHQTKDLATTVPPGSHAEFAMTRLTDQLVGTTWRFSAQMWDNDTRGYFGTRLGRSRTVVGRPLADLSLLPPSTPPVVPTVARGTTFVTGLRIDFLNTTYHEVALVTHLYFAGNWAQVAAASGTVGSASQSRLTTNLSIPVSALTSTGNYVLRCRTYTPDGVLRDEESFHFVVR